MESETFGDGMTDFNSKDWIERVQKAVGEQELRDLINELPDERDTSSTQKDDQKSSTTAPMQTLPRST